MNILVTRTDRLGDVMLATPVLNKIKELYPNDTLTFLVQKQWLDVLQFGDAVKTLVYDPKESQQVLVAKLKERKFDLAIVLRDEKLISRAVKAAGVPVRIGPYSTFRSFFLFNRGKFQKRSRCEMHEAEYNLQLIEKIPGTSFKVIPANDSSALPHSWVAYSDSASSQVRAWLSEQGLKAGEYVCLHPGSSGSSRYLAVERMTALVSRLYHQEKIAVVLTGSAAEASLLNQIATAAGLPAKLIFGGALGTRPLSELAELYRNSRAMMAHGTGPLHLAAAVGASVLAIFPPIFVLSEKRWGPLTSRRWTWTPPVSCPAKYKCQGPSCKYFDCMDLFKVDEAVKRILEWKV